MNKNRRGVAPTQNIAQPRAFPPYSQVEQQQPVPYLMTKIRFDGRNRWTTDLCSCPNGYEECCYSTWCYPCFSCHLAWRMNESCWAAFCIPGYLAILRSKMRTQFQIEGSYCSDFCVAQFCPLCVSLQMAEELRAQNVMS